MWQKAFVPGFKPDGIPILSVICKRTYAVSHEKVKQSDIQIPLSENDTFISPGNPTFSEVADETDLIPFKLTTDIIVKGKAYSPAGKKAFFLECSVSVGALSKNVMVFGPRRIEKKTLRGLVIGDPEPFSEMELGYCHAYGGVARTKNGTIYSYFPNPIGKGFQLKAGCLSPESIQVPHLEDPSSPLTSDNIAMSRIENWIKAPKPASFGWTRKNFYPRYTYAGVLPEQLPFASRRDGVTKDENKNVNFPSLDFRIFQGASDGLWGKQLRGDELVKLVYFDKDNPVFEFCLPGEVPVIQIDTGNGMEEFPAALQTVIIDMNSKLLSTVWRGCKEYEGIGQLSTFRRIEFSIRV